MQGPHEMTQVLRQELFQLEGAMGFQWQVFVSHQACEKNTRDSGSL